MRPSTLTSKYQATIPTEIRKRLGLKAGDGVLYQIHKDGSVRVEKAKPFDTIYLEALEHTLSEWNSKEDDDAFADLQDL